VIVVDSSGWVEYFNDGPNAQAFSAAFANPAQMVVPTITLYEVFKRLAAVDDKLANAAIGGMLQGAVMDLDAAIAINAASLSAETGLAMADAVILATARAHDAELWTQDAHFEGLAGVRYFRPSP
jgi:toxin FitB